ncbi:hypothetical protein L7H23_02300 [Sphingopyxis sp. BSN-002]|uniref:hypothetical protein n=1 Tax=Sphingopyxis sp. BSN-002 TaxID=2911495 RepID=UPI001EDBE70E|nr:hypothetical protein [Sphingopyxis sp. BSN-002]UKK84958.1 hypothetical protein L7H23_02300 [Sphingopyxis sp. BSN-002]
MASKLLAMVKQSLLAWALLGTALTAPVAQACSVIPGYKVPTALELAASSEAIVLARVGKAIAGNEDDFMGAFEIVPETLIYGTTLPGPLTMQGSIAVNGRLGGTNIPVTPSDPDELAKANPDAFSGACNRYVFNEGMLLLLFLKRGDDGKPQVISYPFARTKEDVADANAPWVRAVRFYSSVAHDPKEVRKQKMLAERDRLIATGDPIDALLAKDIERQIKGKRTQNFD